MITFNQLNQYHKTNQYARLYNSNIWSDRYNLYRDKERPRKYIRGCDDLTYLKNIMYAKAGQDLEKHITHIAPRDYFIGHRHYSIDIPYFAHIPNPNGTPGHRTIWVTIDPMQGIYLTIEAPTGTTHRQTITGNTPATKENIQKAAERLFLKYYLRDTHPAAVLQYRYKCTKTEAVKGWIQANKTGYYIAHSREVWDSEQYKYRRIFEITSTDAPPVDATRTILRRLRRKLNIDGRPIWDDTKLIKLLKHPKRKRMTIAEDAPNFWDMLNQYEQERDTEEEIESFVYSHFDHSKIYI